MKRRTQPTLPPESSLNAYMSAKKWYHLNLFQKFALIFLGIVSVSVILIAVNVLQQSKHSILGSTDELVETLTSAMKNVTQVQQGESESVLDMANKEFAKLSEESLMTLKTRLIEENSALYAEGIGTLASESQHILENELRSLNSEVSQGISTLLENFVRESELALKTLTRNLQLHELQAGSIEPFWDLLLSYEQFIYLDYIDSSGQQTNPAIKQSADFQEDDPLFTDREPYLSFALSGENFMAGDVSKNGTVALQMFIPVKRRHETVGVVFGVVSVLPLWERIQDRFFQHEEQIYIVSQKGEMIYPQRETPIVPAIREQLQHVSRLDDEQGTFEESELMLSFTTFSPLKWKIVVGQPRSNIEARIAPVQVMVDEYLKQIQMQLQTITQEKLNQITREMSKNIEERKQEVRQNLEQHYNAFLGTIVSQVTGNVNRVADNVHKKTLYYVIPMIGGLGIIAVVLGIFVAARITRPIKSMTVVAYDISKGNVNQTLPVVHSHDEIGLLSQLFHETTEYLWNIAKGAQKISEGEFACEVKPVSEKDSLGTAFVKMTSYLREIALLANHISHGDLSQVVIPKSESDMLGNAVYRMTLYLQRIANVAKKVADGNLSENPQPRSEKDFLGKAFAEMILKLRHLVSKIRTGANQLVTLSLEAQSRAQEEAESVERISLSVEETSTSMNEMAATIGEVNERMKELSSFVGETSSSIEELNSSIRQIASHGEQLAGASEETSTSIQQISASLQQIADTAKHSQMLSDTSRQDAMDGRDAVEKMIQSMNVIQHMVTVTADVIQLLSKRTESIEKILDVIKDISDQTSLLSINASIIAKKAGERGRGFNVIADKVRKLADQSNLSAKEIAKIIRDVRKESAHAVEVVSRGNEKVQEGVKLAGQAGKALDKIISGTNESSSVIIKIAETTEEQTKISHHIMESMEQVVDMINQIKFATKEQEQSSTYIMKQAEQELLLSQQVKQSMFEQTEVVRHVSLTMDDIRTLIQMTSERAKESTQSASMLSQHADALKDLVSQFAI